MSSIHDGRDSNALSLRTEVVVATPDFEVTMFAPGRAIGVSHYPVPLISAFLNAIADDQGRVSQLDPLQTLIFLSCFACSGSICLVSPVS